MCVHPPNCRTAGSDRLGYCGQSTVGRGMLTIQQEWTRTIRLTNTFVEVSINKTHSGFIRRKARLFRSAYILVGHICSIISTPQIFCLDYVQILSNFGFHQCSQILFHPLLFQVLDCSCFFAFAFLDVWRIYFSAWACKFRFFFQKIPHYDTSRHTKMALQKLVTQNAIASGINRQFPSPKMLFNFHVLPGGESLGISALQFSSFCSSSKPSILKKESLWTAGETKCDECIYTERKMIFSCITSWSMLSEAKPASHFTLNRSRQAPPKKKLVKF